MGTGDDFLNITPVAQTLRATINEWDLLKLRTLSKSRDTANKTICRQPNEWDKIFTNATSDKQLISRLYKALKKLGIKILNNPIKKWVTKLSRKFSTEDYQCPNDI